MKGQGSDIDSLYPFTLKKFQPNPKLKYLVSLQLSIREIISYEEQSSEYNDSKDSMLHADKVTLICQW